MWRDSCAQVQEQHMERHGRQSFLSHPFRQYPLLEIKGGGEENDDPGGLYYACPFLGCTYEMCIAFSN
jgi:hypothetical protein